MWNELREEIESKLAQLERLLEVFADLREKVVASAPDEVEIMALAGLLHCFYNAVENVLKRVATYLSEGPKPGEAWQAQLLSRLTETSGEGPAVISEPVHEQLRNYLEFRHTFRHAHAFGLQWTKMAPLVSGAKGTLQQLETELGQFLEAVKPKDEDDDEGATK